MKSTTFEAIEQLFPDGNLSQLSEAQIASVALTLSGNQTATGTKTFEAVTVGTSVTKGLGVVESGSNANGRYVRFDDGTQICYSIISAPTMSYDSGGTYPNWSGVVDNRTLPIAFNDSYSLTATVRAQTVGSYTSSCHWWYLSLSTFGIRVESASSQQASAIIFNAIGTWK